MSRQPVRNPIHDFIAARTRGQWVGFGVAVAILILGYAYWDAARDEPPPEVPAVLTQKFPTGPDETNGLLMLDELIPVIHKIEGTEPYDPEMTVEEMMDDLTIIVNSDDPEIISEDVEPTLADLLEPWDEDQPPQWEAAAERIQDYQEVLAKVDTILQAEHFAVPAGTDFSKVGIPGAGSVTIISLLDKRARIALHNKRSDAGWEDLLRMMQLGHRIAEGKTYLVGKLTGITAYGHLLNELQTYALQLAPDAATTRHRVQVLNTFRLSEDSLRSAIIMEAQLIIESNAFDQMAAMANVEYGTLGPIVFKPNTTRRLYHILFLEALDNVGRRPTELDFHETNRLRNQGAPFVNMYGKASLNLGIFHHTIILVSAAESHLDLSRVGLALAGYANGHGGALPATLEELAPTYIDAIPADPMTGRPFLYDPQKRKVWSVGENLQDDGGDPKLDITIELEPVEVTE